MTEVIKKQIEAFEQDVKLENIGKGEVICRRWNRNGLWSSTSHDGGNY